MTSLDYDYDYDENSSLDGSANGRRKKPKYEQRIQEDHRFIRLCIVEFLTSDIWSHSNLHTRVRELHSLGGSGAMGQGTIFEFQIAEIFNTKYRNKKYYAYSGPK